MKHPSIGGNVFPSILLSAIASLRARMRLCALFLLLTAVPAIAQLDLSQRPIYSGGNIPPLVMIDLSKDHQLYFKAYNDYSDLDGDGNLETTYTHSIDYYGYFDSYKCYNYNTSANRFVPHSITANKYCSGNWSGNFLNWVAMSRMDAVRKLLYGGLRSTDEPATVATGSGTATRSGITVLERSFQPTDAHAWAKFYNGTDLTQLTPATAVGSGLTFCNMTPGSSSGVNKYSQTNTNAPQIRVVEGNYALWASNERWQCTWSEEHSASNANNSASSGIAAAGSNPKRADKGFGTGSGKGEYTARVQVCVPDLIGKEKCEQYPDLNYKPVGLLQTYGERGQMKFGLMTGSYTKNISGGVLRRNISDFSSEINVSSNGTFKLGSNAASGEVKGIVHNLNKMRIYGYNYDGGGYTEVSADSESCNYQMTGMVLTGGGTGQGDAAPEGNCSSWGNPISEIFLESIRYFAGLQPTDAFKYTSSENGTKDDKLGLTIEAWQDPLTATNYCSPLNTLVFNPAVSSYDGDQMNMTGIGDASSTTAATWTDRVGVDEAVTSGSKWLVGSNGTTDNGSCTAKELSGLSGALGICPEAPTQKGTYLMAGAAYYAKTNRIRTSGTVASAVPAADAKSLKVTTYGIQLASNTPSITINVNGHPVKIIPSYRVNAGGKGVYASGTLVDFKVVEQTATSGKFYVNWEDSNQGGDFDQDVWGILSYSINGDEISVTTEAITTASANGQGFGYVISGTNKDGAHFHSGAYGFNYTDPIAGVTGCTNCRAGSETASGQKGPTTVTYTATGDSGGQLQDPLWYAAKWGGFNGTSGKPDDPAKWDTRRADGSPGSDGVPDNYFFVANPGALETALERAFISILATSSSSSVATNSASLQTGSRIYQARFNATDWSGQLLAFPIDLDGVIADVPEWDAAQKMPAHGSRVIVTYDNDPDSNRAGIPFRWNEAFPYKLALQAEGEADLSKAEQRLAWLRGDQSQEGNGPTQMRRRSSLLGDIVNSNPQFVGKPASGHDDSAYFTFANTHKDREPMLYVGGNDGMLHGFLASNGVEKLAYIPSSVVPNLKELTGQSYGHRYFVDGTPTIADVKVDASTWKTLLIGGLNAGGKGLYALDVTDVGTFSEENAGSLVQWEFTDANDANLGYTFGRPSVVKMANGRWAAVFGNGYNSTTGKAALFIVFLDREAGSKSWVAGTDYMRIDLAGLSGVNGLSSPTVIDNNVDGVADYIYAGDLLGNMWKFDVRAADAALWKVAYGTTEAAQPLYSARSAAGAVQPITSGPEIVRNPAGGFVVLFGTGRYLEAGDARTTAAQTFYGIWDENASTTPTIDRSSLVQQSIIAELTVSNIDYRLTSDESVVYGDVSPRARGWYMDLSTQGERVIYNPVVRNGRLIFTTIVPSENVCTSGGGSWLMELDAVTGGALDSSPLDVNRDGVINDADRLLYNDTLNVVGGRKLNGLVPFPTIIKGQEGQEHKIFSGPDLESVREADSSSSGRLSWREIMQ
ncbi:pilus assembly protein [Oxalicibacterium flavum]|uniref:pilus assembly protein n=1 Tax=Oxalicibacterium flavum TaxID=179467 RepID=UPI00166F30A5|nr:PilC/PilY family type IV pilus protein [Oxalicibacterium flavum]